MKIIVGELLKSTVLWRYLFPFRRLLMTIALLRVKVGVGLPVEGGFRLCTKTCEL